jgi:hypothetical protein
MARKIDLALRETWRERIARQRRSGLTVAEFSRQEGVSTASFYHWRQQVGGRSAPRAQRTSHQRPLRTRASSAARGMAVAPAEATFVQVPLPSASGNPWLELMLTDGTLIRLPHQNLAALQTVLQACQGGARVSAPGALPHV